MLQAAGAVAAVAVAAVARANVFQFLRLHRSCTKILIGADLKLGWMFDLFACVVSG